jgi:S-adenosylmethionine/arginine decarboxylase-like enzyme
LLGGACGCSQPYGATGVLVLSESHFSAHTFVQEKCIKFDIFCCAETFNPLRCATAIDEAQVIDCSPQLHKENLFIYFLFIVGG